jgi:hypothetical protein
MGVSGQRHAPTALSTRVKDPRYPLYRRLGGPQSRSGHRGYRKNPLPLPGTETRSPGRPVRSQTLYWLSYLGSSFTHFPFFHFFLFFSYLPHSLPIYSLLNTFALYLFFTRIFMDSVLHLLYSFLSVSSYDKVWNLSVSWTAGSCMSAHVHSANSISLQNTPLLLADMCYRIFSYSRVITLVVIYCRRLKQ